MSMKNKYYTNSSQNRGHDYGQGFPQQYAYAQLQTVQNAAPHDMSKQVATAQQGMYQNSGGMSAQQHHQTMGGPAGMPNPQQTTLVQQGQQIRASHMAMQNYYRGNVPRPMSTINRPLQAVVNQTPQQPTSQYQHVQVFQPITHGIQPVIMNPSYPPQVLNYTNRPFTPSQNVLYQPPNQMYMNSHWTTYNNPQPASNGYFQAHGMPAYNTIPQAQQMPQQPAHQQQQQQKKTRKVLQIIDPKTGKNVLDGMTTDDESSRPTPEKEIENADQTIDLQVQFAAQVAATLVDKNDHQMSKSSSVEDTRNIMCSNEMDMVRNVEPEDSELGDIESLADVESMSDVEIRNVECVEEPPLPCFKKEADITSINETVIYDTERCKVDVVDTPQPTELRDTAIYDSIPCENSVTEVIEEVIQSSNLSSTQDATLVSEAVVNYYETPEVSNEYEQLTSSVHQNIVLDNTLVPPSNLSIQDSKSQESIAELSETASISSTNSSKLLEAKRNKNKKKKDLNKKGESKEGGEMDAFLDKGEDLTSVPVSSVSTPPPIPVDECPPSPPVPVTIVDSEILNNIPLPGEPFPDNSPLSDSSPDQPSEASSVSPSAESEDKENMDESAQNKIKLKYSYKEDQWSPLNPEGKKQYDRDFLLQLQSQPMSLTKPMNLPNLDVIKDKAHIQKLTEVNRSAVPMPPMPANFRDHFLPQFAQRGGVPRMPQMNYNNRRAIPGRDSKTKKIISLTQNVKLHEADNAWKPTHKQETAAEVTKAAQDKEKLRRNVQGILNKLTPQKFETLLTQLKNLSIDNVEKLNVVIDLIFEKAVDEPNFSVPYANMCKHLALIQVLTEDKQYVNFRKLLLTKCQKEFEQDRSDEIKHEEKLKALAEAEPDKKKELEQEMYDEEKKMRYRQLGNIRFIGELFKLGMLIEPIMHECIKRLLTQGDEESLECLCRLLKTIGKELDEVKSKNSKESMDQYFGQMQKIVDKRLTSSRVRFMLQDVIDLKRNNWIPRRDENNPKTIDQIHKEAEREAREQQQVLQNMSFNTKRIPDDRDRRKSTARNITSEEGWTSSTKSNRGSYSIVDPNKLKLTKPDEVDSIRLGPGRAMQSWGRGSSGGTKTTAGSSDLEKTTLQNRYSALAEQPSNPTFIENRRGSQRSAASSRESSRGRNTQLPSAIRKTPSTSRERDNAIEAVKGLVRGGTATAPSENNKVADSKKTVEQPQLNGKAAVSPELRLKGPTEIDDEIMEKKSNSLIDEFLHINDLEEAIRCVTELASSNTVHMFINSAINQVLERSSQARHSLGQLLQSLVKQKIITFDQYKKGFVSVLELVDEYALDIPLIWEYIGEILEPMIEDNKFPLTFLKEVLEPCIPSETAGMLVSATLHCAAKKRGTIKLGELWRESNLQWSDFLQEKANIDEFIQKHKLEFTICSVKSKPVTSMPTEEIKRKLLIILQHTEECEEIFDWIDGNVSKTSEPSFIRALVSAVHENAIKDSGTGCELDVTKLKKRITILTRYIDNNEHLELQALYAIQSLMNQLDQPKGILRQIFDILYDDDVITEKSFKNWEQSDDASEEEGKGVALHSVKSFFTWLKESDSAESVNDE